MTRSRSLQSFSLSIRAETHRSLKINDRLWWAFSKVMPMQCLKRQQREIVICYRSSSTSITRWSTGTTSPHTSALPNPKLTGLGFAEFKAARSSAFHSGQSSFPGVKRQAGYVTVGRRLGISKTRDFPLTARRLSDILNVREAVSLGDAIAAWWPSYCR